MFKTISAKNMFSWKDLTYEISPGITLVDGFNHDDQTPEGCHDISTNLIMFDGSVKNITNIQVGDRLMGPDSKPREVLRLYRGRRQFYRIVPTKGNSFLVTENHTLTCRMSSTIKREGYSKGDIINLSVKDYLNKSDRFKQDAMLYRSGFIDFPEKKETPLDPYYLGVWLGDGSLRKTDVTTMDAEIKIYLLNYAKKLNLEVNIWGKKDDKAQTINITSRRGTGSWENQKAHQKRNPIINYFNESGLRKQKFIPKEFLTGTLETRLSLLAGLIDSDGYYDAGCYEITQKNKILTDDILFLCRSLGFAAYTKKCRKRCTNNGVYGYYYRTLISGRGLEEIPVRLERKKAGVRKQVKNVLNTGFEVVQANYDAYYGIEVNADNLYLLNDFTVVHNSGKSAIPNIMCWTLFGKIPKEVKIDEVISYGAKSCLGEVELTDGTIIRRTRKPNDLRIIPVEGEELLGKDAKDTQKLIEQLIGFTYETFCQSVYFAQNYEKKFITANETEKGKILSEIQDLTKFDKARAKAVSEETILKGEVQTIQTKLGYEKTGLERIQLHKKHLETSLASIKEEKEKALELLTAKLETSLKNINALNSQFESIDVKLIEQQKEHHLGLLQALSEKRLELKHVDGKKNQLQREIAVQEKLFHQQNNQLQKTAEAYEKQKKHECPSCSQQIPETPGSKAALEKLDRECEELKESSALCISEMSILKKQVQKLGDVSLLDDILAEEAKLQKIVQNLDTELRQRAQLEQELTLNVKLYDNLQKDLIELGEKADTGPQTQKEIDNLRGEEKAAIERISALEKESYEKSLKLDKLSSLKDSFKEIKSYVFQSLLQELSRKSTEYAQNLFEVPVIIDFSNEGKDGNISKILTEVDLDGTVRSLGLLSGGQFRRVQIAVDLAISSIIAARGENPISFRIFDEPMASLSEISMQKMVNLLEGLPGATLLIEHNSVAKSIVNQTFFVEYKDGVSVNADKKL